MATQVVSHRTVAGSEFVRSAVALAATKTAGEAARYAAARWPDTPGIGLALRAASSATSTDPDSGGALIVPGTTEFMNMLKPRTIVGRLGRLRRVPMYNGLAVGIGGAAFAWLGEGAPAPVGHLRFAPASLPGRKVGGIAVLTESLLNLASPEAEALIREEILAGAAAFLDGAWVSAAAEVPDTAPAGIAAGVTPIPSTGNVVSDVKALVAELESLDGAAIILSEAAMIALVLEAPGAVIDGRLGGVVQLIPSSAVGDRMIAVHAPSIMYADSGRIALDSARHATIEMDTEPVNGAAPPEPVELTSMWQTNSTALKVTTFRNWRVVGDDRVAVVSGADYAS
jgi:hypothetical protein